MALSERQQKAREGKMTGSRIATLSTGSPEDVYNLWLELTGDPTWKAPDYSKVWAVQLGNATEQFHLDWIQQTTGDITRRGESLQHSSVDWAAVTLDGWAADHKLAVEAKHVGGLEPANTIIDRYMPQMQWTMFCTKTPEIIFSAIAGAKEPRPVLIARDETYLEELVLRAGDFMECVRTMREPIANPFIKPPLPVFSRMVDMSKSNTWAAAAQDWLTNKPARDLFEVAAKGVKSLVPADAKECYGAGIRVKRSKNGALTIKPEADDNEQDD